MVVSPHLQTTAPLGTGNDNAYETKIEAAIGRTGRENGWNRCFSNTIR